MKLSGSRKLGTPYAVTLLPLVYATRRTGHSASGGNNQLHS